MVTILLFDCYTCRKDVPFTLAADNSVFSVYEFLSSHLNLVKMHFLPNSAHPSLSLASPIHVSSSALLGGSSRSSSTTQIYMYSRLSTSASVDFGDIFLQVFCWHSNTHLNLAELPLDLSMWIDYTGCFLIILFMCYVEMSNRIAGLSISDMSIH